MIKTLLPLAAIALLNAAPAAAQDVRVPFGDLNLSSAAGAAAFDARIAAGARDACVRSSRLVDTLCVRRVTREAVRQLPQSRQDDYARARRAAPISAEVTPAWPA
jgi:UrcA family protein